MTHTLKKLAWFSPIATLVFLLITAIPVKNILYIFKAIVIDNII